MRNYKQFYTAFGVRRAQQLLTPPLPMLERLQLPRQSIVHYMGESPTEDGPKVDYAFFANNVKPIRIKHIFELVEKEGNPRRQPMPITELTRQFRSNNPRFRNFVDLTTALREPDSITTVNYAFLPRLYKYMRHRLSPWNKLKNQFATLLHEVKECEGQGFNQFLEISIPDSIPKTTVLSTAETMVNPAVFVTFATPQLYMLLEIWKWLGPRRNESVIHRIFPEGFKDLNLIVRESNRFCVVSLALLQSWRKGTSKELRSDALANRKGTDPQATQRRFLRLLMSVAELRVADLPENLGDETQEEEPDNELTNTPLATSPLVAGTPEDDAFQEVITKDLDVLEEFGVELEDMDNVDDPDGVEEMVINENEVLNQDKIDEAIIKPYPATPKEAFLRKCADLADKGDISASEYRRAVETVSQGSTAFVGGVALEEYVVVEPEELQIKDITVAPDIDVIIDKTMLKSSVNVFDRQYVEKVMQKDIAGMVQNIMGAGIQIMNYDVKTVATAGGAHYEYAIQIKPLQGKTSTIRFKIPKIDEEGNYKINGISYSVRKQKGD